jgi:hypothetical protein
VRFGAAARLQGGRLAGLRLAFAAAGAFATAGFAGTAPSGAHEYSRVS